jgi:hypothetical protein
MLRRERFGPAVAAGLVRGMVPCVGVRPSPLMTATRPNRPTSCPPRPKTPSTDHYRQSRSHRPHHFPTVRSAETDSFRHERHCFTATSAQTRCTRVQRDP